MIKRLVLDSGPLSMIAHPRPSADVAAWLARLSELGVDVMLPEIADFEVRRELLRAGKSKSIRRLDIIRAQLTFLPLDSDVMLRAAQMWADARRRGRPTADDRELDVDVILAAQAEQAGASVATDNIGHLSQFVHAQSWRDFGVES